MNLYEIDSAIIECVDMETGEIVDIEKLTQLQMERDTKIENISCWIKNLVSDAEQLKNEEDKLKERRKYAENKADSLKKYLKNFLNGEKFKTAKVSISYRKTSSVEVSDMSLLPEKYKKYSEPEAKKAEINADIKSGKEVPGAFIVEGKSMIIK